MIRFAPLQYRIATVDGSSGPYHGYAMQLPRPFHRLRFCVRKRVIVGRSLGWVVDHYDTGESVCGPVCIDSPPEVIRRWSNPGTSRAATARWLVRYLHRLRRLRNPTLLRLMEDGDG